MSCRSAVLAQGSMLLNQKKNQSTHVSGHMVSRHYYYRVCFVDSTIRTIKTPDIPQTFVPFQILFGVLECSILLYVTDFVGVSYVLQPNLKLYNITLDARQRGDTLFETKIVSFPSCQFTFRLNLKRVRFFFDQNKKFDK